MHRDLPSTGETQAIAIEEHRGFVDNCIALIENLLGDRSIAAVKPREANPARE